MGLDSQEDALTAQGRLARPPGQPALSQHGVTSPPSIFPHTTQKPRGLSGQAPQRAYTEPSHNTAKHENEDPRTDRR